MATLAPAQPLDNHQDLSLDSDALQETESTAFLQPADQNDDARGQSPPPTAAPVAKKPEIFGVPKVLLYCILLEFLLGMSEMILISPFIALLEQSLCRSHYQLNDPSIINPDGSVPETFCKIPEVQKDLANIRGWKAALDTLPVFLVGFFFGRISDRIGRRKVMAACVLGIFGGNVWALAMCNFYNIFPLRLVFLSWVFNLCGGGMFLATAMVFSMTGDACPEEYRNQMFYYWYSTFLLTEILAPALASATMDKSLWIPCGLSVAFLLLTLPLLIIMPETKTRDSNSKRGSRDRLLWEETLSSSSRKSNANSLRDILYNRNMLLVVPFFIVAQLRPTTLNVVLQYSSVRFGWKLSRTAVLLSVAAGTNLATYLLVIPQLVRYVQSKYRTHPQVVDLAVARYSISLLAVGALLIGLAPSMTLLIASVVVFAAGYGMRIAMLSLTTAWVHEDMRGAFYAVISIVENTGYLTMEPLLQSVFAGSLNLPSFWLGIPFFLAAVLFALAGICTIFLRLSDDVIGGSRREEGVGREES